MISPFHSTIANTHTHKQVFVHTHTHTYVAKIERYGQ